MYIYVSLSIQGFKVAYVVFNKAPALKKALLMDWPIAVFSSKEHTIPTGLSSMYHSILLYHV